MWRFAVCQESSRHCSPYHNTCQTADICIKHQTNSRSYSHYVDCSVLGIPVEQLRVVAHRHDLRRRDDEEGGVSMSVKRINVHPGFQLRTLQNDVAVWELEGGDSLTDFIELDSGAAATLSQDFTVIGWGAISEGGPASDQLLQVDVPSVDNQSCQKLLLTEIPDTMLCAGGVKGKDGCQGDSGMFNIRNDTFFIRTTILTV